MLAKAGAPSTTWLVTVILLILVFQVARIKGVNHQHPAPFKKMSVIFFLLLEVYLFSKPALSFLIVSYPIHIFSNMYFIFFKYINHTHFIVCQLNLKFLWVFFLIVEFCFLVF
jgi:hypothetical protein